MPLLSLIHPPKSQAFSSPLHPAITILLPSTECRLPPLASPTMELRCPSHHRRHRDVVLYTMLSSPPVAVAGAPPPRALPCARRRHHRPPVAAPPPPTALSRGKRSIYLLSSAKLEDDEQYRLSSHAFKFIHTHFIHSKISFSHIQAPNPLIPSPKFI